MCIHIQPVPTYIRYITPLVQTAFENILTKGEISHVEKKITFKSTVVATLLQLY